MTTPANHKDIVAAELKKDHPDWRLIERLSREKVDTDPHSVRFSVDAGHIKRLGLELVAKQETALAELIKNAYDADATSVTVLFSDHLAPNGRLVINDNGSGMTSEVVREAWMRISTAHKEDHPVSSRFKRVRAGRKGIGRFAVQRLGQRLIMETEVAGDPKGLRVTFGWDDDFQSGTSLYDVFSSLETYDKPPERHGTSLLIDHLRESWPDSTVQRVWKAVLLLQPPFRVQKIAELHNEVGHEVDPGFDVVINGLSSRNHDQKLSIETGFLNHSIAHIYGEIRPNGTAFVHVYSEKLGIDEKQEYPENFLLTGPVSFSTKYFIYESGALSGLSVSTATEMGRQYGGIRIYRGGFRVLPYGERGDDWLKLDRDVGRRYLLNPSNNTNFFGEVELDREQNPLFEETSSREGLIENDAFEELRNFVREGVDWGVKRVAAARNRKLTAGQKGFVSTARPRKPSEVLNGLIEAIDSDEPKTPQQDADTSPSAEPPLEPDPRQQAISLAREELEAWEKEVEAREQASLQYEEMLRILASLGISITVFGHEIKGIRGSIASHLAVLHEHIAGMPESADRDTAIDLVDGLETTTGRMFDLGGYIAGLMSSTESRELKTHSVKGVIKRFYKQFNKYMERQQVEFEICVPSDSLRTTEMHSSEIDSVLLNFLTNSIKSMKKSRVHPRRVRITAEEDNGYVLIGFEDNGGGISPEIESQIFDAFFTTTIGNEDDGVAGPGTGLGLKIVSDIARSYGGQVNLAMPSAGFNCRFEFRVLAEKNHGETHGA